MERVRDDLEWTLMCPDKCPGLADVYGNEFKELYESYERENKGLKIVKARTIWFKILDSQMETGVPYMLYKDACNEKSNQKNLGTIKSSNLCTEIVEYSDETETAVCNLASIALARFVKKSLPDVPITIHSKPNCSFCKRAKNILNECGNGYTEMKYEVYLKQVSFLEQFPEGQRTFPKIYINGVLIGGFKDLKKRVQIDYDYEKLHKIVKIITFNLNRVIDVNFYPTKKKVLSFF